MAKAGTPVFTDDSGVRRVSLQVVARAMIGVFVLASGALTLSLVLGVPLPGLDRLVPGIGDEQAHQATRDAPLTDRATSGPHDQTGSDRDAVAAGDAVAKAARPSRPGRTSSHKTRTATHMTGTGATSSGGSRAAATARPSTEPTSAGTPSAAPRPQPGNPSHKPSSKPRNANAATPARGKSAFSSSRAHRSTATASPTTTPGKSAASHGKSDTGGSG